MVSIRVILADDHAVVRSGLRRFLDQSSGIEVISEADSGEMAYQHYVDFMPDVLVMDMSMPGMGGLEALRRILSRQPSARVIIFSMHENASFASQAIGAGARGYVAKSGSADDLVKAIREVAQGKSYLSPTVAQKIVLQSMTGDEDPTKRLSAREFEVFRLLADGKNVDEIAEILRISQKTVANYQTLLKQKLGVSSPVELVRLAIKFGLIEN